MSSPILPFLAEISGGQWIAISAILGGLTFTILLIYFGLKARSDAQAVETKTPKRADGAAV